jgi:hypothetical protein
VNVIALLLLAEVALIELHGPGGQRIYVNPTEVTSIRAPRGVDRGHFARGTRCLIYLTSQNFLTVTDSCETVRALLEQRW